MGSSNQIFIELLYTSAYVKCAIWGSIPGPIEPVMPHMDNAAWN